MHWIWIQWLTVWMLIMSYCIKIVYIEGVANIGLGEPQSLSNAPEQANRSVRFRKLEQVRFYQGWSKALQDCGSPGRMFATASIWFCVSILCILILTITGPRESFNVTVLLYEWASFHVWNVCLCVCFRSWGLRWTRSTLFSSPTTQVGWQTYSADVWITACHCETMSLKAF